MLSKLQYISQGTTFLEQEKNIKNALENGADWIQVRWKNTEERNRRLLCKKTQELCKKYDAVCIINDSVNIAKEIDADGVHLGLMDTSIANARKILGPDKIIGGTANTFSDVMQRINENCTYIGLGPFSFTETKTNLSPILGLNGYTNIMEKLKSINVPIPKLVAIGGIQLSDIQTIQSTGIYGIAISGLITNQPTIIHSIKKILQ